MTEQWRPVLGWEERYEVSDHGRVRSIPHSAPGRRNGTTRVTMTFPGRVLKQRVKPLGHFVVFLSRGTSRPERYVHSLVIEAFVGPRPPRMECCHDDGNPANNAVGNLRWDTKSANTADKVRHGKHPFASRTHCPQGHPYDEVNTYRSPKGGRACRMCRAAAKRHTKKAAA